MTTTGTVPEQITAFLQANRNVWFCDSCIQERLELKRHQQAQQTTSALSTTPLYTRQDGTCSICGRNLTVITNAFTRSSQVGTGRFQDFSGIASPVSYRH